jgi:hypothetical protein
MQTKWVLCPVCENKTRLQLWADRELKNFSFYCPKCKQERGIFYGLHRSILYSLTFLGYYGGEQNDI